MECIITGLNDEDLVRSLTTRASSLLKVLGRQSGHRATNARHASPPEIPKGRSGYIGQPGKMLSHFLLTTLHMATSQLHVRNCSESHDAVYVMKLGMFTNIVARAHRERKLEERLPKIV